MAAVPSIGRAARIEQQSVAGADTTRSLFERFAGQIYGYCLHQLGSREEAEDAVQTTFMNAFRGLQRGIVPEVESAWLFKIARNVCLSRRRSSWRRGRVEAPNNLEVLQEVVPARECDGDDLIRLQDVLERMPESQRRAILLREWQGLSYREIADELQLSQAAVETLIFRARRALAAGLEEAPAEDSRTWRKRARHSIDAGGLLAAFKTLFATGGTVKVAATVAAVATTALVASDVTQQPLVRAHRAAPVTHVSAPRTVVSPPMKHLVRPSATQRQAPAPHASRPAPAVRRPAPRLTSAPTPSPVPAASSPAPVATPQPAPPANAASPAPAPKSNPGKGHTKTPALPSAMPAPAAAPAADPSEHGQASAPGQQDKPDKPDNGNANGHK